LFWRFFEPAAALLTKELDQTARSFVLEILISQSIPLGVSTGIAIHASRAAAPVGIIGELKIPLLSRVSANDNRLAWPYIPFPENLLA
jgi:hypothetical protein